MTNSIDFTGGDPGDGRTYDDGGFKATVYRGWKPLPVREMEFWDVG